MNAKKQPQIRDGSFAVINEMNWLRGQDLFKTLQLVLGYEVVSRALNRRYLQQKFAITIGYVDRNAITNID
jgi:hypothetical protein